MFLKRLPQPIQLRLFLLILLFDGAALLVERFHLLIELGELGGELVLANYVGLEDTPAATAADAAGNFVVVWQSWEDTDDGSDFGIYAKLFQADGTLLLLNSARETYDSGAETAVAKGAQLLLAYTSSGPWRGATPTLPLGVIEFSVAEAKALRQRPFHIDLRCLAQVPLTSSWLPDLAQPDHGVVAVAGVRLQARIERVFEELVARSRDLIEIRGLR